MYLKYLPKLTHFSHEVMMHGTMLAALDHNKNANRQQAVYQDGQAKGELRYKVAWSKVHKGFRARPVLEKKNYSYMRKMIGAALSLAEKGNKAEVTRRDRTHIMATEDRPPREEVILKRQQLSRFH
ncbi:hypothetical protein OS493_018652 [Desmophyllum pertusum]|uniref:Uncharacterized protein n=1 Tax=Desmophyllum pertusum TaxID=174260 RepID=A0A9W9ZPS5_9CNID|nr:hypothetical protein OS493_018652 [Desmophyllum pertusum]